MNRRALVRLIGAGIAAWPLLTRGQQSNPVRRVGALIPFAENDAEAQSQVNAFRDELRQLGWVEGRNLRIDFRWAANDVNLIRTFAKELVALKPDVILARTTPVTAALRGESRSIPIVFVVVSDPLGDGFVESLARPGGNVTGFTNVESSVGSKWLELLKEIVPRLTRVEVLFNPKTSPGAGQYYLRLIEKASSSISVTVAPTPAHDASEIERAIASFAREPNGALIVLPDVTNFAHRDLIMALTARHRLPAIYPWRSVPEAGGLVSYGVEYVDIYRRAAGYVDRVLRGAKPGELPVQAPTKFDLVINAKTAKTFGISIPQSVLLRANKVIE